MKILQAQSDDEIETARMLFKEYELALDLDLCFQNFAQEIVGLPGRYAPPDGRLLLAYTGAELAGCVALRRVGPEAGEMKRLFVRSSARGQRVGAALVQFVAEEARKIGYTRLVLDTLPGQMTAAVALYRSFGFVEIEPYMDEPYAAAICMGLVL